MKLKWFFWSLLVILMALRVLSDHTQNFHYTGEYHSEKQIFISGENFEKLGLARTRLIPIPKPIDPGMTDQNLKKHFYTHFPPLPHWLFGGVYVLSGHREIFARIVAILISFLGLFFALKTVRTVALLHGQALNPEASALFLIPFVWLALNPHFLLFGDSTGAHSLTQTLVWLSLYWILRYLFYQAGLWWGILLYFFHVWVTFEWMVPLFFIIVYCIWKREGSLKKSWAPWLLFFLVGFFLPLFLRILQNAWALGSFAESLQDLVLRAKVRSLGDPTDIKMKYFFFKHMGKIFFGLLWFGGVSVFLMIGSHLSLLRQAYRNNPLLFRILAFWGIGSISWQFLMPQNSMHHANTQIPIANFLTLLAALCGTLFWEKKKTVIIALTLLFSIGAGMMIKSEIVQPFLTTSTQKLSHRLCAADIAQLQSKIGPIKSSMVYQIQNALKKTEKSSEICGRKSRCAKNILTLYAYTIKSRLGSFELDGETRDRVQVAK